MLNTSFWSARKVLITGHTGFKGSWLSLWLQQLGADVVGVSLAPPTDPNLFTLARVSDGMTSIIGNLHDFALCQQVMEQHQPEIVIHMAAQSLVRHAYHAPIDTYMTNVMGTVHVLEAARHVGSVKAIVNVTTDKCYENKEWVWGYRENDRLGGYDPYSSSKACAELVTSAYRSSYLKTAGIGLASARAGNVIGGGDWATDRLIPDIMRACMSQQAVSIRHPHAYRPWQHVLDPLHGYLCLAEKLHATPETYAEGWNFGPRDQETKSVGWIVEYIVKQWGCGAQWRLDETSHPHEATHLKLDCSKATTQLGWTPQWNLEEGLRKTVEWYRAFQTTQDMHAMTIDHIQQFMQHAQVAFQHVTPSVSHDITTA